MNVSYLALGVSAFMMLISLATYFRNGSKEYKKEIEDNDSKLSGIKESLLKANMKLDQVCATTNETRTDIKSLNKDLQDMDTRVSIIERDLKTAFRYIEEIKGGKAHEN